MNRIKGLLAGLALGATLALPAAALANDCANFSRAAPADPTSCTLQGNWLYMGCLGFPHWGFITPGTDISQLGLPFPVPTQPNAHGNYTDGRVHDLLGMSALCDPTKGVVLRRQDGAVLSGATLHGIWSGCGH